MPNIISRQNSAAWRQHHTRPGLTDAQRRTELARLLPLWPHERDDLSLAGRQTVVRKLERALRVERQRGRAGHWAYDVARHAALVRSWRAECAALRAQMLKAVLADQRATPRGAPSEPRDRLLTELP